MERRRRCQIACRVAWPWLALGHPTTSFLPLGLHGFRLIQGRSGAPSAVEAAVRTVPRQKRRHQLPMRPLAALLLASDRQDVDVRDRLRLILCYTAASLHIW